MARKNFLLADTIEGAQAISMWFSLIVSARMKPPGCIEVSDLCTVSAVCLRNDNRRTG